MSFLSARTDVASAATSSDVTRISTWRETDAIAWAYGIHPFGSHWLCEPFAWREAYGGQNQANWQYCSIASGHCLGPVRFVGRIWFNQVEITNLNYWVADGEDAHTFTLNPSTALGDSMRVTVYFGTESQTANATLAAGTGQPQPHRRGVAWALWQNLDLGRGSTSLPSIEIEFGLASPTVGTFAPTLDRDVGVNPIAAIYGYATDPRGNLRLGAALNASEWAAQATALESIGVAGRTTIETYCSPIFASNETAGTGFATILAYINGLLRVSGDRLQVDWFPNQVPAAAGLTEISEHDLAGKPSSVSHPAADESQTDVTVVYNDTWRRFETTGAESRLGLDKQEKIDRPFQRSNSLATRMAQELALASCAPQITATLPVQLARAVRPGGGPLLPGDLLNWDYAPESLDLVCRVTERRERLGRTATVELAIERERGAFPAPYAPATEERLLPTYEAAQELLAANLRFVVWPLVRTYEVPTVVPLVERPTAGHVGYKLALSPTGSGPWSEVLDSTFWAAKGTLISTALTESSAVARIVTTSVDWIRMQAQDTVAQADDTLLLLIGDEMCSVGAITTVASHTYDLTLLRGRVDTLAAAHAIGSIAFVFYRMEVAGVSHAEFENVRVAGVYDVTQATKYFQLQSRTGTETGLYKPDAGIAFTLPDGPRAPFGVVAHSPSTDWPVENRYIGGVAAYAAVLVIEEPNDGTIDFYEFVGHSSNTIAPTEAVGYYARTYTPIATYYSLGLIAQWLWIRSVDLKGNPGPWLYTGLNMNAYLRLPAGWVDLAGSTQGTKPKGERLVFSYGALGDGTSNDRAAIVALIADAPEGTDVVLTAGVTYRITGSPITIDKGIRVLMHGAKISTNLDTVFRLTAPNAKLIGGEIDGTATSGATIGTGTSTDFDFNKAAVEIVASFCQVDGVEIHHFRHVGVSVVGGCARVRLLNLHVHHCHCDIFTDDDAVGAEPSHLIIRHCVLEDAWSSAQYTGGLKMSGQHYNYAGHELHHIRCKDTGEMGIEAQGITGLTIGNCQVRYTTFGISLSGVEGGLVHDCKTYGCTYLGYELASASHRCQIKDCQAWGKNAAGTVVMDHGIEGSQGSYDCVVENLEVYHASSNAAHLVGCQRIRFSDCVLQGAPGNCANWHDCDDISLLSCDLIGTCYYHVFIDFTGQNVAGFEIIGCTFVGYAENDAIIFYNGSSGHNVDRVTIRDNITLNATRAQYDLNFSMPSGTRTQVRVENNVGNPGGTRTAIPTQYSSDITVASSVPPAAGVALVRNYAISIPANSVDRWFKIFEKDYGAAIVTQLYLQNQIDGRQDAIVAMIGAAPYGQDSAITLLPGGYYGGGNIKEVIYNNPGTGPVHEIWIRVRDCSAGTITIGGSDLADGWISAPTEVTTEPTWGSNSKKVSRRYYSGLQTQTLEADLCDLKKRSTPSYFPTDCGAVWVDSGGALKYRSPGGTTSTIGAA